MLQVLVRELDAVVVEKLMTLANKAGRSLEAEMRLFLQQAAGPGTALADVARVRSFFAGRSPADSTDLIRVKT